MQAFARHGGQLGAAMRTWPDALRPWIDLSTGINPWPYPAPRATRLERSRLPDPERIAALEAVAAHAFGVSDPARVLATPGAEATIGLLPHLLEGETVWVKSPTYGSHADAWSNAGRRLQPAASMATIQVVVNPNNPDGRTETAEALAERAAAAEAKGGWLVVDESFIETIGAGGMAPLGHSRVVVLRSFGKFYGLAGLRLGFLIGPPDVVRRARVLQGDWAVSVDAIAAGLKAYADPAWMNRTRARLTRAALHLDGVLRDTGFEVLGGTSLFRLARAADARERFERLCALGVLTRPFVDQPDLIRFGLPHHSHRDRLAAALEAST